MPKGINKIYKVLIGSIIVIVIIATVFVMRKKPEATYEFVVAEKHDLVQLVSVNGSVNPVDSVDLSFEVSGKISAVLADVGDRIKIGDEIISLENTNLTSEYRQAQANLSNEQARLNQLNAAVDVEQSTLDELKGGARDEDIRIAQTKLDNARSTKTDAQIDLANTKNLGLSTLENLYQKAKTDITAAFLAVSDTVNVKTDDMFSSFNYNDNELTFAINNTVLENQIKVSRTEAETILDRLSQTVTALPTDQSAIDLLVTQTQADLTSIKNFLTLLSQALAAEAGLDTTTKGTYQTNLDAARTEAQASSSTLSTTQQNILVQKITNDNNINASESALNLAINAVTLAQDQLDLTISGATSEEIVSQEARLQQAKANVNAQYARINSARIQLEIIQSNIDKTTLLSPIDGIVTRQNGKVGEITSNLVTTGSLVSIISDTSYEIEAHIPEVDISKIKINNEAEITLDSYGSDQLFFAKVVKIDPAETIIEGIPTYQLTLHFDQEDERIKSGMTANIDILTGEASNVVAVPQRAVVLTNNKKIIRVLEGEEITERAIVTGLTSWDGQVEIKEGISEGEKIITFIE